jgi:tetratricopeptide (TPR) repeat protein
LVAALVGGSAALASDSWQKSLDRGEKEITGQKLYSAECYFRQAAKEMGSEPHKTEDMVNCLNKLANTLTLQHKTEEASKIYQQSLKLIERTYGTNHPKTVKVLLSLGSIYEAIGDHNSAMRLYQRAMDITESGYGPYDPAVASGLKQLGQVNNQGFDSRFPSALSEQPGWEASQQLLHKVDSHSRDLLIEQENSDQSLIADFQREMRRPPVTASIDGNLLSKSQ